MTGLGFLFVQLLISCGLILTARYVAALVHYLQDEQAPKVPALLTQMLIRSREAQAPCTDFDDWDEDFKAATGKDPSVLLARGDKPFPPPAPPARVFLPPPPRPFASWLECAHCGWRGPEQHRCANTSSMPSLTFRHPNCDGDCGQCLDPRVCVKDRPSFYKTR